MQGVVFPFLFTIPCILTFVRLILRQAQVRHRAASLSASPLSRFPSSCNDHSFPGSEFNNPPLLGCTISFTGRLYPVFNHCLAYRLSGNLVGNQRMIKIFGECVGNYPVGIAGNSGNPPDCPALSFTPVDFSFFTTFFTAAVTHSTTDTPGSRGVK